uniref:Si:ch73-138n13.1 n=1 Tax=Oryzias latipes TaxID=8090 RepID=A0A3P9JCZ5_ORYLA
MAAQVDVQPGELGLTVAAAGLHLSPLSDSSNKSCIEIPSVDKSKVIASEPSKPVSTQKARLTPKPFVVERNLTIKPILAPKPQSKPRPESTRMAGHKPDLPSTPKPNTKPLLANSTQPAPTFYKTSNKLNSAQTTKPVAQPFKSASPFDPDDQDKLTSSSSAKRQKSVVSSFVYSKSFAVPSAAEWCGTTAKEKETNVKSKNKVGASITRAKSMGFLDEVGFDKEEKDEAKHEVSVPLRPKSSRPRPVSAIFPDSLNKVERPVPAPRRAGRRPLSADLTSKFESIGLSLHRKSNIVNTQENAPAEKVLPQKIEDAPNPALESEKKTEENVVKETEEENQRPNIKSCISHPFDSSSLSVAGFTGQGLDPQSPVQSNPETETSVGVKQLIKQLTEDPTQRPAMKPTPKPRPLSIDLTKRFSSEKSPDLNTVTDAADRHEISKVSQREDEELANTLNENKILYNLKESEEQLKDDSTSSVKETSNTSQNGGPADELHTLRAFVFDIERHIVTMSEEKKSASMAKNFSRNPSFKRETMDGALPPFAFKEPASPSSPLRVVPAFDTVQAIEEKRAVSESVPSAQWEDKAMTLRSRRSDTSRPGVEWMDQPQIQPPVEVMPVPRFLRVGALPKWTMADLNQDLSLEKGTEKEFQRDSPVDKEGDRQRWAEEEEGAAAHNYLTREKEEQLKPRATYFALTGQMQEPSSPKDAGTSFGEMTMPSDYFPVRSALGGSQGKILSVKRNVSLEEALERSASSLQQLEAMMRRQLSPMDTTSHTDKQTKEKIIEVVEKTEQQIEKENQETEIQNLQERVKEQAEEAQRQLEEEEKKRSLERIIELERQELLEIKKPRLKEKERSQLHELERPKQNENIKEAEKLKMMDQEMVKEPEKQRETERERQKQKQQERKNEVQQEQERRDLERQREKREKLLGKERQRKRDEERQRELDKEQQLLETQKQKQKMEETEKKELERRQLELQKEREKQWLVEEAEKIKLVALEKEWMRFKELEKERARQKELEHQREVERETQKEMQRKRWLEIEKLRQRDEKVRQWHLEKEKEELEIERARQKELEQERALAKERQRKRDEERQIELNKEQQHLEIQKQKQKMEETEKKELERQQLELQKEREKQWLVEEAEKIKLVALEKEWMRFKELEKERARQKELEHQREVERENQKEMQRKRWLEIEKLRQRDEKERQWHLEKEKEELERLREIEREKLQEQKREQAKERQRDEERQRELDRERLQLEMQQEKHKKEEEKRELERQQLELQKQKQRELERQLLAEEAEQLRKVAQEQELLKLNELEKERQKQLDRERLQLEMQQKKHKQEVEKRELERQQLELQKQKQKELERQLLAEEADQLRQVALEQEFLKLKELEKEREKQREIELQKEVTRQKLRKRENQLDLDEYEFESQKLSKRELKEKMEKEEAEKIRQVAKQQEVERRRLREKQRKDEERLKLESSAMRPKVLDLDSVLRDELLHKASSHHRGPSMCWREPHKPAILDIDSPKPEAQPSPNKDLFPVSDIQELDAAFGFKSNSVPERDLNWKVPPQATAVWTMSPQDPWELQPVEVTVDKPVVELRKSICAISPTQAFCKQDEQHQNQQNDWPAFLNERFYTSPLSGAEEKIRNSLGAFSASPRGEEIWIPRESQSRSPRRLQGSQELNRMRSRSMSRKSARSNSSVEESLSRMRSRSANREHESHSWQTQSGEEQRKQKHSETPVRETDSQYGTWETELRSDDSLTSITPSSDSFLSLSQRKSSPPTSLGDNALLSDKDTLDGLPPPSSSERQPLTFPDAPTTLLDNSALRSKAQLGKKRAPRMRPTKAVRQSAGPPAATTEDWLYRDSTEAKPESQETELESEKPTRGVDVGLSVPSQLQRVAVFPVLDPSALKAQLKRRSDSDNQTDGPAPSPSQPTRSPKSPFLPQATRVLPPLGGKENGEKDSPKWLKELKSKKRFSQYENENN